MFKHRQSDSVFKTGSNSRRGPIQLPREVRDKIAYQQAMQDMAKVKQEALDEFRREKEEIQKLRKEQQELLLKKEIEKPLPVAPPILTKAEKLQLTPTEQKLEIKKKVKQQEEAEELQEYLSKEPEKPAEGLLKKLVKKTNVKKYSAKTKKRAAEIYEIENRVEDNKQSNDKILDAIKGMKF
jgi:hypothetical protein